METDPLASPKQEDNTVFTKEETLIEADPLASPKRENNREETLVETGPLASPRRGNDSVFIKQEPLECPFSDNFPGPSTSSVGKMEDDGEEEAVSMGNLEELKCEAESTSSGSEPESAVRVVMEDIKSNCDSYRLLRYSCLSAGTSNSVQCTVNQERCGYEGDGSRTLHKCSMCKKVALAQLQDLAKHNRYEKNKEITKQSQCRVCHMTFKTYWKMQKHMREHGRKHQYSCGVCNKTFREKGYLKKHSLLHTGERKRPYSCGVCKKTFSYNFSLERHSLLHTGERPYSCDICKKTYTQDWSLKRHSRLHTGERPYMCNVCKKTFTYSSTLKQHSRIHTGDHP